MTKIYPIKINLANVNDYLDGGDSIRDIAKKYSVRNTSPLSLSFN
jgi:transposase-like protein